MKRVFLIFAEQDSIKVKSLLEELKHPDCEFDFYEINPGLDFESLAAEAAKREIGRKIVNSEVTLCLISEFTHQSKWVDCGLQKSRHKGNKIFAMALKKVESAVLPKVVKEENLRFYPWDPNKLWQLISSV